MIITVPAANVVVPRAVGAVVGAASSNPYTAAAVGVVVTGLAVAKYIDLAGPNVRAAKTLYGRTFGSFKRKVHNWSASPGDNPAADAVHAAENNLDAVRGDIARGAARNGIVPSPAG